MKTYHAGRFDELGLRFAPMEEFFSTSRRGVLRGMHFQLPPHDHAKLVYCVRGVALDVLLDLRTAQPTYGRAAAMKLSRENSCVVFIPAGIAHGFLALEDNTVMVYKTTSMYAPSHDAGVRWDSFGFDWGMVAPLVSARDADFPGFSEFQSPF